MKLSKNDRNRGGGRIMSRLSFFCVCGVFASLVGTAFAAKTYTIEAPNGVGDVAALTNALTELNKLTESERASLRVWLEPGLYDLRGVFMNSASHLKLNSATGALIAGLGDGPDKTILLGGGDDAEMGRHRILDISGNNWGYTAVSNLTVTGGYSTSNGGGITGNDSGSVQYYNLIVSNNYAVGSNGGGGGGCMRGRAFNCLFADNGTAQRGGGLWTSGGCGMMTGTQGAWDCVFTNNYSAKDRYGGGLYLSGKCKRCKFFGNYSNYGGGVSVSARQYVWYVNQYTNTSEIVDSVFEGNYASYGGSGLAVYNNVGATISKCVFSANCSGSGSCVVKGGNLYDCVVTNNTAAYWILYNCNLERCLVSGNTVTQNQGLIDGEDTAGTHTNVNCVFANNVMTSYGRISNSKAFVNCTIVGNDSQIGANYGFICAPDCNLSNCILSGNKIGGSWLDIRAIYNPGNTTTSALHMANCVFVKSQNGVDENWEGLVNCKQVADVKFVDAANGDYTPKTRSYAYDAGLMADWILDLVGDRDLAGNPRVFGNRLDAGAYESQCWPPGCLLIVK